MSKGNRDYKDIPGTYVFDLEAAVKGYAINKFCESLNRPEGREQFLNNEDEYLTKFGMTDKQIAAVKARDLNTLLSEGGNIYYLYKIAAVFNQTVQAAGAIMADEGMTEADFRQMMIEGGRSIEGNRSIKENNKLKREK